MPESQVAGESTGHPVASGSLQAAPDVSYRMASAGPEFLRNAGRLEAFPGLDPSGSVVRARPLAGRRRRIDSCSDAVDPERHD